MRPAVQSDCILAINALVAMRAKNPNKQMRYADPDTALAYMQNAAGSGNAVVVDGYFIMYAVTPAWFSIDPFLIEELIIRIYPTDSPVEVAIAALDELKALFNCVAIVAGDTQVGYMTPKYLANGFVRLGEQLIKE